MDVQNDPGAAELLLKRFGVRRVPIVAKDDRFVFAHILDTVAEFIGATGNAQNILPPPQLFDKWMRIMHAAQRNASQIPDQVLEQRATPKRARSIRIVAHHVFVIVDSHIDCLATNAPSLSDLTNREPPDGTFTSAVQIATYGEEAIGRINQWWNGLADKSLTGLSPAKDYGPGFTLHKMLEFSVSHSTQHSRQIADVLERLGITPAGKITPEDLRGLPLPERIWE